MRGLEPARPGARPGAGPAQESTAGLSTVSHHWRKPVGAVPGVLGSATAALVRAATAVAEAARTET
ncbi:hypothetical protein AB0941_32500 [Streptomyces sp. NPDC013433]|uniref:hypothetical protein n=1 Tax=Streptomyces sp. NPDC013433 TaxID=3155604 RepID=UPI003454759B